MLEAGFGEYFAAPGSLLADIEGEGDDVEELIPFVCMPGGIGRLTFEDSDCVAVAEGAIDRTTLPQAGLLREALVRAHDSLSLSVPRCFYVHTMRFLEVRWLFCGAIAGRDSLEELLMRI